MFNKLVATSILAGLLSASVALAETTTPASTTETRNNKTINVACIQSAVGTRDDSMIAARNAYNASIISALQARKTALQSAWALTDTSARKAALKSAWKAYRDAARKARSDFKKSRHSTWQKFHTDRKACNVRSTDESEGADEL